MKTKKITELGGVKLSEEALDLLHNLQGKKEGGQFLYNTAEDWTSIIQEQTDFLIDHSIVLGLEQIGQMMEPIYILTQMKKLIEILKLPDE